MSKPLNEFGGWLNFFRFCIILSLIFIIKDLVLALIALTAFAFIHTANISSQAAISAVVGVLMSGVVLFVQVQILKKLKTQSTIIPTQISKLFIVWLVVILANIGIIFLMNRYYVLPTSFEIGKFKINALASLIIPLSWLIYSYRSKRVKAYYGAKAFEQYKINF